ncbi:MAG TPA: histidinol dehydrogenase, partial [Stellaceae bacterium]|nr:histidinol dehydrogenase [Stellaceae bacterium]
MPRRLDARAPGFETALSELLADKRETAADVDASAAAIIESVRRHGDAALRDLTQLHDRVDLPPFRMRISAAEIEAAERDCDPGDIQALDLAAERIESYHRRLMPTDLDYVDAEGIR